MRTLAFVLGFFGETEEAINGLLDTFSVSLLQE